MKGYTTYGSVRGGCGVLYKTYEEARKALQQDRSGCARQGGYSDRHVVVVGNDDCLYYDETCQERVYAEDGTGCLVKF